jgi:hypothetical protein
MGVSGNESTSEHHVSEVPPLVAPRRHDGLNAGFYILSAH